MPEPENQNILNLAELQENFAQASKLTQKLIKTLRANDRKATFLPSPDLQLFAKSMSAYFVDAAVNPADFFKKQLAAWKNVIEIAGLGLDEEKAAWSDKRFANPLWNENLFFSSIRKQYQGMSELVRANLSNLDRLGDKDSQRLDFYREQFLNFLAPGNFLATNPDVLKKAVETNGASLVSGLENLINDLVENSGRFGVSLADTSAFEVGQNVATTPGEVVFQGRLFQLIQYKPTTKTVHETPLLIFPPWINKFYILDLQPENSFIKYAVSKGFSVFVVSWVNPDASHSDISFDDYMKKGSLKSIEKVKEITGKSQVNAIGYCVGGTLLTCTLAWMKQKNDDSIRSATFFTTLNDFENPGELGVFIDDKTVKSIAKQAGRDGFIDAHQIKQIFSYLRSNELVYGPAIKSYMLGIKPPAFDLLYWNGDSPNLPGKMAVEYLDRLYKGNLLVKGKLKFGGKTLDLADIDIPIYAVATINDHIAPWKASFSGLNNVASKEARFVLAGSGHIAGVINPANSVKYGHWMNPDRPDDLDAWFEAAEQQEGSWWNNWAIWLKERSGKRVKAASPGSDDYPPLEHAPGSYVKG